MTITIADWMEQDFNNKPNTLEAIQSQVQQWQKSVPQSSQNMHQRLSLDNHSHLCQPEQSYIPNEYSSDPSDYVDKTYDLLAM